MPEPADPSQVLHELDRLQDPASDLNQLWDREHDIFVARRVLEVIERDFVASTWQAFRRVFLDGATPAEVAAEMGISVNAVHLAKWRVLRRARREIARRSDRPRGRARSGRVDRPRAAGAARRDR